MTSIRRVICGLALAALLAACGSDDGDATTGTTTSEPTSTEGIEAHLTLVTFNGLIGGNVDDQVCDWGPVRVELADRNEGDVLALEDVPGEGRVVALMPFYECHLDITLDVPAVDFYEVTVSGTPALTDPWTVTDTFAQDEIETVALLAVDA